jgi:hypothetical protein
MTLSEGELVAAAEELEEVNIVEISHERWQV